MCSYSSISDTHKREKANLLATKSPIFGSHSSANGHVPHAYAVSQNASAYYNDNGYTFSSVLQILSRDILLHVPWIILLIHCSKVYLLELVSLNLMHNYVVTI